jgi:hypothetical protein
MKIVIVRSVPEIIPQSVWQFHFHANALAGGIRNDDQNVLAC